MQWLQSHRLAIAVGAAVLAGAALSACAPRASEGQSQVVEGLKLDYEIVAAHPTDHAETTMHGGVPSDPRYHVVLRVADAGSGQRVTDAQVSMEVFGPGHPGVNTSRMDPMTVNGQQTYGQYVVLPLEGTYQLKFEVRRPGQHRSMAARFVLRRPV
jgi:uncharacterized protein involved in high-affinity Fe2+ transport